MTLVRMIAPQWLVIKNPNTKRVIEGLLSTEEILNLNELGYNAYYLPNGPKNYIKNVTVDGTQIDNFQWLFVDMDLKENKYESKDVFISCVAALHFGVTKIVDSGNGVHVYWKVADLDVMSYLRLQRRLMRLLNTDEAVCQIFQLMRLPETLNTKKQDDFLLCETLFEAVVSFTCEEMDKLLPAITVEDEAYCLAHYNRTYNIDQGYNNVSDVMPPKFGELLANSKEAKEIWVNSQDDRSKGDYRLGHLMYGHGFTKEEAASVLINSSKALARGPSHRLTYARNIIDKIWTFETLKEGEQASRELSESIGKILETRGETIKGTPFRCHPRIDNTVHGFRLGQVIGLVAGSGVGKTSFALNMFRWFSQENPEFHHFFVPLEQPSNEIADRWQTMCDGDTSQYDKIHIISNYDEKDNFRHLSLEEIQVYIENWKQKTGKKVGCVVIDHIGALKKKGAKDENQDLVTICHSMKAFAQKLNCLLVMQSQTSREKAGIGDLELNKDAAYGTIFFESYCDYLITLWQPLKRCHSEANCPTVTAFKFCKIRHKKAKKDIIQEDMPYYLFFDSNKEQLRDMTQNEKVAFTFYLPNATNKRKNDRKTELVAYISVPYEQGELDAGIKNPQITARH